MLTLARNFLRFPLPVLIWMAFIFMLSSVPGSNVPNPFPYFHLAVHFIEYSVLALLCMRALHHHYPEWTFRYLTAMALGIAVMFAASDEWHQTFVSGRSGQARTVFFDGLYACIGAGLFLLMPRRKR